MHYASLESLEQEQDDVDQKETKEEQNTLKSVLKSSGLNSLPSSSQIGKESIPSTLQGIDSLPEFQRTKLPSNPHLPIINIRPAQE